MSLVCRVFKGDVTFDGLVSGLERRNEGFLKFCGSERLDWAVVIEVYKNGMVKVWSDVDKDKGKMMNLKK